MFGFGMPEMIIILLIMLVVFGAGKIPELTRAAGLGIANFKKSVAGKDVIEINPGQEEPPAKKQC